MGRPGNQTHIETRSTPKKPSDMFMNGSRRYCKSVHCLNTSLTIQIHKLFTQYNKKYFYRQIVFLPTSSGPLSIELSLADRLIQRLEE